MDSNGRMWGRIGSAYNLVKAGDVDKIEGSTEHVTWKVYAVGSPNLVRVDINAKAH